MQKYQNCPSIYIGDDRRCLKYGSNETVEDHTFQRSEPTIRLMEYFW